MLPVKAINKADIIARLEREILPLQGFKPVPNSLSVDIGLGPIRHAFPNGIFPAGAVHEFICEDIKDTAPTGGFIAGILSKLMLTNGAAFWISSSRTVFPPALASFGIEPHKIIFVDLATEKDVLYATEEALKCDAVTAVITEISKLGFTASRRLQLAVEQSRATGFIVRTDLRHPNTTACIARWKISSSRSSLPGDMPGVGFPCWNVQLLKVRNGKPGSWRVEWKNGEFHPVYEFVSSSEEQQKQTG